MEIADKRGWKAGQAMGEAIIEMIHLMYQNQTALAFIKAITIELNTERNRREDELRKEERENDERNISSIGT